MSPGRLPLYLVLRDDLHQKIRSGEYSVGQWLPSEAELQRHYGMSQTPVRRALTELEQAGFISRHQGRGSVVTSQEITATSRMIGLGTELRERGHDVRSAILGPVRQIRPPDAIVDQLRMGSDDRAAFIRRMFIVDGVPSVLFEHYLAPLVPVSPDELSRLDSLYLYLSRHDVAPQWAQETITATLLTAEQSAALETDQGAPALVRKRVAFSAGDVPIEHTTYWIRADRYAMHLRLRTSFA